VIKATEVTILIIGDINTGSPQLIMSANPDMTNEQWLLLGHLIINRSIQNVDADALFGEKNEQ
jgi:hypothetical protein